jgi:hypothetical protein
VAAVDRRVFPQRREAAPGAGFVGGGQSCRRSLSMRPTKLKRNSGEYARV